MHEIITPSQARLLTQAYHTAVVDTTPREAVQITDAFRFTDYELGSVLGRYSGRVYETFWEEVQKDPVNSEKELREPVLQMIQGRWRLRDSKL